MAGKLAERAYAQASEQGEAEGSTESEAADDDNVVDAEFEEVDDEKK